eukprot:TRINITY_DN285_c0_g1_i1.p1 TRINITY_DN285_c0_g1~~TRINITY_DN285_c0_g1_i1.p1  ORF type:complete len:182 (-),score=48.43 TRINITY_DN285_c0_g1_i1:223-768(-)
MVLVIFRSVARWVISYFFFFFFLMIRRPPRSTHCISSAASDVYKRQYQRRVHGGQTYQQIKKVLIKQKDRFLKYIYQMVKKIQQENIAQKLSLVIRSGKVCLGQKSALKAVRQGKAKLVFIASNCPTIKKSQLEYYAMLAKIKIYNFPGTNSELGTACGKLYKCSSMAIIEAGDSDILNIE